MTYATRWFVLGLSLAACSSPPLRAPTVEAIAALEARADSGTDMPRPRLGKDADTNDAGEYFRRGADFFELTLNADTADMALYWASRLDPSWADPFYARALATISAYRKDALDVFWRTNSPRAAMSVAFPPDQARRVDSLLHIAWGRNPFLFSVLDPPPTTGGRNDPSHTASDAYTHRHFAAADSSFAKVLKKHPDDVVIRVYRARALFFLGHFDGAVTELEAARDTVRRRTSGTLSFIVPSIEMFDFAIGIARVQQDDFPAARAAFERALVANLGFYWAHVRLAGSALKLNDTTTALTELDQAVQMEAKDPVLRLFDGVVLHEAGREPEAAAQLERAELLDPYYADPYYWLAEVYRRQGRGPDAVRQYQLFLGHATRTDPGRKLAQDQLAALGGAPPR
ncbi:MAG TPA: tetratricopeptide repeat protein [Gemmatimonadales bacterium]|nr:tetratricopeptide repeat protein [Gemmatimonadales bacterium]